VYISYQLCPPIMKRIIFYLSIVVIASCKMENQPPTCEITHPENSATFSIGDAITVSVEANDPDGSIHEIQLYFDGIGIASLIEYPYNYTIETEEYSPGGYIIKATALDEEGLSKSNEIRISINAVVPAVTTAEINTITDTTAMSGGDVTDDGGADITSKGVCWNMHPNPTVSDNHTKDDGTGLGEFTSTITGLEPNRTYYVRAYALNAAGTAYGEEMTFTTLPSEEYVIDYDGNTYRTVHIGEQTWMAENLKVTHYADGTAITLVESNWHSDVEAYCWYANSTTNRDTYGGLYNWAAAMKGAASSDTNPSGVQGVCPDGWHLPSDEEWKQLEMHLGMSLEEANASAPGHYWRGTDEGGKLKENGTSYWSDPNTGATNSSGFTALPGFCSVRSG
jgi:uncharacterized protein (TIGR02145 family)